MSASLRTFTWIDRLEEQVAGFLGTVCTGDPPHPGDAALFVEVAPAMDIHRALDAVLKGTRAIPGLFAIEREFGVLELHSRDQAEVREAGRLLLGALGLDEDQRTRPRVVTRERMTGLDPHHAQIVNRMRHGNMQPARETMFVLELEPAGYALLAANEAEKAARIEILEFMAFGAFGRVYLGGDDAAVQIAAEAAIRAVS